MTVQVVKIASRAILYTLKIRYTSFTAYRLDEMYINPLPYYTTVNWSCMNNDYWLVYLIPQQSVVWQA